MTTSSIVFTKVFIKRVEEKRSNARLVEHFIVSFRHEFNIFNNTAIVLSCSELLVLLRFKCVLGSVVKQQEITKTIYSFTSFMEIHK